MSEETSTVDVRGGNNQFLPKATTAIQNVYIGDDAVAQALNAQVTPVANSSEDVTLLTMNSFSFSLPQSPVHEIIRKTEIAFAEKRLKEHNILCLTGEEGVGLTTLLAQFARAHSGNCVCYFYDGFERIRLEPEIMEKSIVEQLNWFVNGINYDKIPYRKITDIYSNVIRKLRQIGEPLYFVLDGFDKVPSENLEGIKRILGNLLWERARFIFTGDSTEILKFFSKSAQLDFYHNEIMCFGEADVKAYFHSFNENLDEMHLAKLYEITRGNAHRMSVISQKIMSDEGLEHLMVSDITGETDLYDEDFRKIFSDGDIFVKEFFALLAYVEFPLTLSMITCVFGVEEDKIQSTINEFPAFIIQDRGICKLRSEGFRKYLTERLEDYKQPVELKLIKVLETGDNLQKYSSYIPALYKSLNQTDKLIKYLSSENIHRIFVNRQSQAALNLQCDYGYAACQNIEEKYMANIFQFALTKSTSHEIENNEMWDNEIEALLAVNKFEQALVLAQNIYLLEERLKAFLLIARRKKEMKVSDLDVVNENIHQLIKIIDFENIPNKGIELAKLLMPFDYEAAVKIIDDISKRYNTAFDSDHIYTLLSLSANEDGGMSGNFDMVSSKIQDDTMRSFAKAAKSLFANDSVEYVLSELNKLPKDSQKLHLLMFWLPEHKNAKNVGKAVLVALKLIMSESNVEMPKAKVLNSFCGSMKYMDEDCARKSMVYLDSMKESIKFPTYDYVDLELTIIGAIKGILPQESLKLLEDLYLYIDELQDASVRLTCLSKLLGKFEDLGDKRKLEVEMLSTVDLSHSIRKEFKTLLGQTAYHNKVVEGPIKALVCNYRSLVDEMIAEMNTSVNKSRAYSYAARQYLKQEDESSVKLQLFFCFLSKTKSVYDRQRPLETLAIKLLYTEKIKDEKHLEAVKDNFHYYEEIENPANKAVFLMCIYIWVKKNFTDEDFSRKIRSLMLASWNTIDILANKIGAGFFMAKHLSKVSLEEACVMIDECESLKEKSMLASSSSIEAYRQSLDLYTISLCYLIRTKLCDEVCLETFASDIKNIVSPCEEIGLWGNIALEYHLANDDQMFYSICNQHFPASYDQFSLQVQKSIIYQNSPALFLWSQDAFFKLLDNYEDEFFVNECIRRSAQFVICKNVFLMSADLEYKEYKLSYKDYTLLLSLLEHSTDEYTFYHVVNIIGKSLKVTNVDDPLSIDQKGLVIGDARRIVEQKLPTLSGIQHDGYKLICLAALDNAQKAYTSKDKNEWKRKISAIKNTAVEAFVYFSIAPFFSKQSDMKEFFEKGISLSESISSIYDKEKRLDMSISECMENKLGSLVPEIANSAMQSLRINGSLQDHKDLVDMIYQHKPELAEQLVKSLDQDPARLCYKNKLLQHIHSMKKISKATKKLDTISSLDKEEQIRFFNKQLEQLLLEKGQVLSVKKVFSLAIQHIFQTGVSEAKAAIIYLMETVYKKQLLSANQKELMLNIHQTIRSNFKIALSLGARTKERLLQIDKIICENPTKLAKVANSIESLMQWYQRLSYNALYIVDAQFEPVDLEYIKKLSNINSELKIYILANKSVHTIGEYKDKWGEICSGIIEPINISLISYKKEEQNEPLKNCSWICYDVDEDLYEGRTLGSLKDTPKEMLQLDIQDSIMLYNRYVYMGARRLEGKDVQVETFVLE